MNVPHRRWGQAEPPPRKESELDHLYQALLGTPEGLRLLDDLFTRCHSPTVDYKNIDSNLAVWLAARHDLFEYIRRRIDPPKKKSGEPTE